MVSVQRVLGVSAMIDSSTLDPGMYLIRVIEEGGDGSLRMVKE